jgi:peptidoglycan/xylan/chitin deacetylase (PgdA/CDA1 family)
MQRRNRNRQSGRRSAVVAAVLGIAIVLVVVWATVHSSSPMPSPMSSTPGVSFATVPGTGPTGSPSQGPVATFEPEATPAPSYPLVDSCNPRSVPGAIPVAAPAAGKASSFVLHVPILMYHRIVPFAEAGNSIPGLVVPPETFAAQLDALQAAGWHTITMATLANDLQARVKPPERTFVITIDDGWDDGYTYALPVLAQHGFLATYFVIAGRIDRPGFLTSAHLQALIAAGDEIGDHTMDHVDLATQPAANLTYEIDAAAARIAQVTGHWPESFAYPSGIVDSQAAAAAAACQELRIAVIEDPAAPGKPGAPNKPSIGMPAALETWANRFVVPRIRVTPATTPTRLEAALFPLRAG